jgi:hypothetical protein
MKRPRRLLVQIGLAVLTGGRDSTRDLRLGSGRLDGPETHWRSNAGAAGQSAQLLWWRCGGVIGYDREDRWTRPDILGSNNVAKQLREALSSPVDAALYSPDLGSTNDSRLFISQSFGPDQQDGFTLFRREPRQRSLKIGKLQMPALLGGDCKLLGEGAVGIFDFASALSKIGMELIADNREHPALEVGPALELVEVT